MGKNRPSASHLTNQGCDTDTSACAVHACFMQFKFVLCKDSVGNAERARQRLPALRLLLLRQPPQQHLCGHRAARGAHVPHSLPSRNAFPSRRSAAASCAPTAARPPLVACRGLCPGPRCQERTPWVVAAAPVAEHRLHSMHGRFATDLCRPRLAAHALLKGQEEVAALLRRTAQRARISLAASGRQGPMLLPWEC